MSTGHFIHAVVERHTDLMKTISTIRKYSGEQIGTIKGNIENRGYAVSLDWDAYDVLDEINRIDPKEQFRAVLAKLEGAGATLKLCEDYDGNVNEISMEISYINCFHICLWL